MPQVLQMLQQVVTDMRYAFPRFYVPVIIMASALMLFVIAMPLVWLIRLVLRALLKKLPYTKFKNSYLKTAATTLAVMVLFVVFNAFEISLVSKGYMPGSFFINTTFVDTTITIIDRTVTDERGMTTLKPGMPYFGTSINQQGFYSPFNFDKHTIDSLRKQGRKIVFYIGDSFVQGVTDGPPENMFMQFIARNNPQLAICALGVGGTDPANYRLIAEKYIPELQPDEVWLIMCAWNDLPDYNRTPVPGVPEVYSTTMGDLYVQIPPKIAGACNLVLPADSAYNYYRNKYSLHSVAGFWPKLARQSVITTKLYHNFTREPARDYPRDSMATYNNIRMIDSLCISSNIPFHIELIPTPAMANYTLEDYRRNTGWVYRDLISKTGFCDAGYFDDSHFISEDDMHFNDKGNGKYALYLQTRLNRANK